MKLKKFKCDSPGFGRCITDRLSMVQETKAWAEYRNKESKLSNWQFRAEDARIKFKSLYPSIQ